MKKWMLLLSPVLLMSTSVDAWGGRYNNITTSSRSGDPSLDTHFPFNADQGWFVEQSYLLLKPTLGDLDYGDLVSTTSKADSSNNDQNNKIKLKSPQFGWDSGVRLGIGRYLPHHDKWDISFYTTYFYGDAEAHVKGNVAQGQGLATSYDPILLIFSEKTKASWQLNYFVWDLMLGRQFAMTPEINFHPYIGLRGTAIYTDFKSSNFGSIRAQVSSAQNLGKANIKMHDDFWGIGSRIGTNFDYRFSGNWSFLSNFAASILYGRYHVKETTRTTSTFQNPPPFPTIVPLIKTQLLDHDNAIRINVEGAIGLGWEVWCRNNTVRVAPNLQFEGSLWFDTNNFFNPMVAFAQEHRNLGLMGLTFNLQVDF